jgi:hypothetical protein
MEISEDTSSLHQFSEVLNHYDEGINNVCGFPLSDNHYKHTQWKHSLSADKGDILGDIFSSRFSASFPSLQLNQKNCKDRGGIFWEFRSASNYQVHLNLAHLNPPS